jgi:hypothetical protein
MTITQPTAVFVARLWARMKGGRNSAALFQEPDQSARIIAIIGIVLSALSLILFAVMIIVGLAGAAMDPQFQQGFGK